jgi:hypothetical protein
VLRQLCLQEDHILSGQEALEQRVLCPLAISQQDFVHFGAPFVIRNIIGNDIARRLAVNLGFLGHRFST